MFTFVLIILSLVFLAYSIFLCRRMTISFTRRLHKRSGHIMLALIILFFIGFVIYLIFSQNYLFGNFLAGLLFFLTAFFIMLVLQVNHSLIISLTMKSLELKEFSESLLKETGALTSSKVRLENIKSILEQKNRELVTILRQLSAKQLSQAKSAEIQDLKQEHALYTQENLHEDTKQNEQSE